MHRLRRHPERMIELKRSEMRRFIKSLSADDASKVLKGLLEDYPLLTKKIYDAAMKVASGVDSDTIRGKVFCELDMLDMNDLSGRAGKTRYGYVEPHDAAWELFEEALAPFIDEMKKNQQRALPATAKAYCIGIIKGLRQYEKDSRSDFKDWVTDAPGEYVDTVVEEWRKGNPNDKDIAEVMSVVKGGRS
jgi:hypothetical protein